MHLPSNAKNQAFSSIRREDLGKGCIRHARPFPPFSSTPTSHVVFQSLCSSPSSIRALFHSFFVPFHSRPFHSSSHTPEPNWTCLREGNRPLRTWRARTSFFFVLQEAFVAPRRMKTSSLRVQSDERTVECPLVQLVFLDEPLGFGGEQEKGNAMS